MTQPRDYDETKNGRKRLRSSAVTPSQPPLPFLPDELIREILLRLPARSLLRLRTVCSSWRTLISSSQFANDHVRRSIDEDPFLSEPRAFYHQRWIYNHKRFGDFSVRSLLENPFEPTEVFRFEGRRQCRIIGSCNGLLCLLDFADTNNKRAMLWNPCTGLASQSLEIGDFLSVRGFGYDHVNDKYKLFGIVIQTHYQKPRGSETRIFTFCPKPSKRTIQDITFSRIVGDDGKGVFVPGTATLNWIRQHDTLDYLVLSLDLVKETFTEFSLPLNLKDPDNKTFIFSHLCVLNNCLAFCFNHRKIHWSVWVMKEYGVPQSWTELAIIPCHPTVSGNRLWPLYIWGNNVLVASSSKIVRYNLDDGSFEFPAIDSSRDGKLESNSSRLCFHIYHESLISPPSYGGLPSSSSQMPLIKP